MNSKRRTARIPDSQRKRQRIQLTLGPEAHAVLSAHPNASRYVDQLVAKDQRRTRRRAPHP